MSVTSCGSKSWTSDTYQPELLCLIWLVRAAAACDANAVSNAHSVAVAVPKALILTMCGSKQPQRGIQTPVLHAYPFLHPHVPALAPDMHGRLPDTTCVVCVDNVPVPALVSGLCGMERAMAS